MTGPVDRQYYETSGYFKGGGEHLLDPESAFHRYRVSMVLSLLGGPLTGARVLDLGCGWGTLSFALARTDVREVVGVDFAQASISLCEERLRRESIPKLSFLRADARETGLPSEEWDMVVAADLVEHLYAADTEAVYREAFRLLRPGGEFLVWTPNPQHFLEAFRRWGLLKADPTHVDYKTLGRVRGELEAVGFRVEEAGYRPSHLPVLRVLERGLQQWVPWLRRRVAVRARKPAG